MQTGFSGKDELRYAQIAKEMDSVGNHFFLHFQGEIYPDKPPLYFWMVQACYSVSGGVSPWGVRFPLVLCTVLTVLLTWDMGRRLFGRRAALWCALFYGLSFRPIWSAHIARLDPPLVLFTTLAFWFFVRDFPRREIGERPRVGNVVGFWVAMALGFLVKGPLALLVPGGVLLFYAVWSKRFKGLVGGTTILVGVPVFLLLVLGLWVLPGMHFGGEEGYLQAIWDQEVVGRSAHPWRHTKEGILNWVYYFGRLAGEFLPGSLLLPGAFVLAWRRMKKRGEDHAAVRFVLTWFFFVFLFFTFMNTKRGQYILPMYPAAGLLVGWFCERFLNKQEMHRLWVKIPLFMISAVSVIVLIIIGFSTPVIESRLHFELPITAGMKWIACLAMGSVALSVFIQTFRNRFAPALRCALAMIPVLIIVGFVVYYPKAYPEDGLSEFADVMYDIVGLKGVAYTEYKPDCSLNIYGHSFLRSLSALPTLEKLGLEVRSRDLHVIDKGWERQRDMLRAFRKHPEPMVLLLTEEEFAEVRERYKKWEWNIIREHVFPSHETVFVLSNVEDYATARRVWEAESKTKGGANVE